MHWTYPLLDARKRWLELLISTPGAEHDGGGPKGKLKVGLAVEKAMTWLN